MLSEVYTEAVAKQLHSIYKTAKYDATYYLTTQLKRWGGRWVADCSGLIHAFRSLDDTANGLMQKCKEVGLLRDYDGRIGRIVFCVLHGIANHVGIMVSGGYVGLAAFLKQQKKGIPVQNVEGLFLSMMQSAVSASIKCDKEKVFMEKKISCCGMICSDCEYYPADCLGCREIKGEVFWLEYTGESCCEIYECCINHRKYEHCGQCEELPCSHYERDDPTKTKEENAADHCMQLKNLKKYRE